MRCPYDKTEIAFTYRIIDGANGKTNYENITFDVSFTHAVVYDMTEEDTYGKMNIGIKRYQDGYFIDMYEYSYDTVTETANIYAEISGYQSGVDYISGKCRVSYDNPVRPLPKLPSWDDIMAILETMYEGYN